MVNPSGVRSDECGSNATRSMFYGIFARARWNSLAANSLTTLTLMSQFGELLELLARADVRHVLVGGGAVLLHGHSRVTADLDILAEATENNAHRLREALSRWGEGAGAELTSISTAGGFARHRSVRTGYFYGHARPGAGSGCPLRRPDRGRGAPHAEQRDRNRVRIHRTVTGTESRYRASQR